MLETAPAATAHSLTQHERRTVDRKFLSPGVGLLITLTGIGFCFAVYRFIFGLQSITNLNDQYPWGLWIAIDVATGVALAAGGFTAAALAHIFHREHYEVITRPALLTAALGYTFVGIGLLVDLGRWYNIWHPTLPMCWQGNSVLFEVAMCVMCYLTVLYIEFLPIVCERFMDQARYPRLGPICAHLYHAVKKTMFFFIIAGVVLSCLHQSSLGNLMVLAPYKMSPLWYTPILSLLFLLSAIAVGFPMVIFESLFASWSFGLKPEMHVLSPLAKYIPPILGVYLCYKMGDMFIRESWRSLDYSLTTMMFGLEVVFGLMVPLLMLLSSRVRNSPRWLFIAALTIVLGVVLNRVNVFLVAYQPPYVTETYFPAVGEFAVTIGLVSLLMLIYRAIVINLPVIHHAHAGEAKHS